VSEHDAGQPEDTSLLYRARSLPQIAARWDAKAPSWDADLQDPACHLNEDDAYARFVAELNLAVCQRREFCAGQGAIDIGCATGLVLERVLASFAWGLGVDISPDMIERARKKRLERAQFVVGDCFELYKFCPPGGAVFSRGVLLSHYGRENATQLLRSAREVLVPGGFGVWDFLNQRGKEKSRHQPASKTYFEAKEICDLATEAGFNKVKILTGPARRVGVFLVEVG
jgi:SAM-dependent methyltransferase